MTNKIPFYETDKKYSRGQTITYCPECKDTSFNLMIDHKDVNRCARCGKEYVINERG